MFDFLKKVPLFANLQDDDLNNLCAVVQEEFYLMNEIIFTEGDTADKAYVIMEGEIDILKHSGGQTVLLATRKTGDVIGEMSLLDQAPRFASGSARTDCKLLAISHENLDHLLDTSPSAARVLLSTITNRLRTTEIVLRQSEKMAQLGTLTAGIAHELNNPASAANRSSEQLHSALGKLHDIYQMFFELGFSKDNWEAIAKYHNITQGLAGQLSNLNSLERNDREQIIEDWLNKNHISESWELAPILVNMGFQNSELEEVKMTFADLKLAPALQFICISYTAYSLMREINEGTKRIAEIIGSLKSYVYLDQAPTQLVDLNQGINNTLIMLKSKFGDGIQIERKLEEDLPKIQAFGSELNQVWTNIIDNAVDAMSGEGKITIQTRSKGNWVIVEIEDSGPGMSEEVQRKLFSPFFTTKPLGKGTGLGLNISFNIVQKHQGQIKVSSQPGKTRFTVQLPINFTEKGVSESPLQATESVTDQDVLQILKSTKTIAVVGISSREISPGYTVPKYLQEQGFKIIPVNPNLDQVLGEKAYADLASLKNPPDLVLIFRHNDHVAEIVKQAIKSGTKTIWMQEGIINLQAAETARNAGIKVVMDTCLRKTHQRLKGKY
jgi:signal transduction histidine kinase/predicted CoA-binding protein